MEMTVIVVLNDAVLEGEWRQAADGSTLEQWRARRQQALLDYICGWSSKAAYAVITKNEEEEQHEPATVR